MIGRKRVRLGKKRVERKATDGAGIENWRTKLAEERWHAMRNAGPSAVSAAELCTSSIPVASARHASDGPHQQDVQSNCFGDL